jgi:hypothetical protein
VLIITTLENVIVQGLSSILVLFKGGKILIPFLNGKCLGFVL